MPNPQNLKPFKKGYSGNPRGRPRLPRLQESLASALSAKVDGVSALEAILGSLVDRAKRGDVRAAELLLNRAYGKALQITEVTGTGALFPITPPIAWVESPCVSTSVLSETSPSS